MFGADIIVSQLPNGVAQLRPGEHGDAFLGRADKKLYEAKGAGRNRVAS